MIAIYMFVLVFITWVFFTAVMRLREIRDAGKLTAKRPVRLVFAYTTLFVGLILDTATNLAVCTLLGLELPKIELREGMVVFLKKSEWLTTARLNRWYASVDARLIWRWRRGMAEWFGAELLNDIDPDGVHIK